MIGQYASLWGGPEEPTRKWKHTETRVARVNAGDSA